MVIFYPVWRTKCHVVPLFRTSMLFPNIPKNNEAKQRKGRSFRWQSCRTHRTQRLGSITNAWVSEKRKILCMCVRVWVYRTLYMWTCNVFCPNPNGKLVQRFLEYSLLLPPPSYHIMHSVHYTWTHSTIRAIFPFWITQRVYGTAQSMRCTHKNILYYIQ